MGLAAVVGDEGAEWASEDLVEEHAEGECEQALGDALGESGECFCEVVFESHLAFEVGEDGFDDQADAGFFDLAGWSFAEAVLAGGDQVDVDQLQRALVFGSPKALVGKLELELELTRSG